MCLSVGKRVSDPDRRESISVVARHKWDCPLLGVSRSPVNLLLGLPDSAGLGGALFYCLLLLSSAARLGVGKCWEQVTFFSWWGRWL